MTLKNRFALLSLFSALMLLLGWPAVAHADHLSDFPASVDPGAILQSQMMNRYYQQLMFLQGPISIDDLQPKEPVIIDEQGILPDPKDVHGDVTPEP